MFRVDIAWMVESFFNIEAYVLIFYKKCLIKQLLDSVFVISGKASTLSACLRDHEKHKDGRGNGSNPLRSRENNFYNGH